MRAHRVFSVLGTLVTCVMLTCCTGNSPWAPIYGHVVFKGLTSHQGIDVRLSDNSFHTTTDAYGYFFMPSIVAGDYVVIAHADGVQESQGAIASVHHSGLNASEVHLALTPVGQLHGAVIDEAGDPVMDATIDVLGSEARAISDVDGVFRIDPMPAGVHTLLVTAPSFSASTQEVTIARANRTDTTIALNIQETHDLNNGNHTPVVDAIHIDAVIGSTFPRSIPLVDTSNAQVRPHSAYTLSVDATDPDNDTLQIFWHVDGGTLSATTGTSVTWTPSAGAGTITLIATAVDPFGGVGVAQTTAHTSGASMRGATRTGAYVFYAERRGDSFDLYRYDLTTGEEVTETTPEIQEHLPHVVDQRLVYGDTEFVFVTPLVYHLRSRSLSEPFGDPVSAPAGDTFGQNFSHDDVFTIEIDLYTPSTSSYVPIYTTDSQLAPAGYGYYAATTQQAVSPAPFAALPQPADITTMARDGDRDVWITADGILYSRVGNANVQALHAFGTEGIPDSNADLQVQGDWIAYQASALHPVWLLDLSAYVGHGTLAATTVGDAVTSFALYGDYLAYVEQGPSSSDVKVRTLSTADERILTREPHYARRIWHMDDTYIVWSDQSADSGGFANPNAEVLWIDRVHNATQDAQNGP